MWKRRGRGEEETGSCRLIRMLRQAPSLESHSAACQGRDNALWMQMGMQRNAGLPNQVCLSVKTSRPQADEQKKTHVRQGAQKKLTRRVAWLRLSPLFRAESEGRGCRQFQGEEPVRVGPEDRERSGIKLLPAVTSRFFSCDISHGAPRFMTFRWRTESHRAPGGISGL